MRRDLSSVDSLDGMCASTGVPSTDDDSISLYSDYDSGTKPQKLETRIGINHFNRYVCYTVHGVSLLCRGFIKGQALSKLTSCEDYFV